MKLPDVRSMGQTNITGTRGVSRLNVSDAGAGMAAIASGLDEMNKRRSEFQTRKAQTQFLTGYTSELNSYDERTDFQNFTNDFRTNSETLLNEAAEQIQDPRQRQQFLDEQMLRIQQGEERIRDQAFGKERDYERGEMVSDLGALRDSAIRSDGENVLDILENVEGRLRSSVDVGYYSSEEAEKLLQSWRVDVSTARIEGLEPDERIEALSEPWASNIPEDVRQQIERDAKTETKEREAIDISDSYIDQGLTRVEAMEQMSDIDDPELRQSVERRFDYQFGRMQQAEAEKQQNLFNDYQESISTGETTIDFIPRNEWDQMDSATRQNLRNLQADAAAPRTMSDPDALIQLAVLKASEDYAGIVEFLRENNALLKASDRVKYAEIAIDGSMPIEVNDNLTDIQHIQGRLAEAEINDKNAQKLLLNRVGDWRRAYIERNNKAPDDAQRDAFLDSQLMEFTTSAGFLWDSTERGYEMDDADFDLAIRTAQEQDNETLNQVINYYTERGYEPTKAELLQTYQQLREMKGE